MVGANSHASQGSLPACPDLLGEIDRIWEGGGRTIVVDPRRTGTAERADEWVRSCPGLTPPCCSGWSTCCSPRARRSRPHRPLVSGVEDVRALCQEFTPELVAPTCGVPADRITQLARELARAPLRRPGCGRWPSGGRPSGRTRCSPPSLDAPPSGRCDLSVRTGPWGDRYGEVPDGLALDTIKAATHRLDLGLMVPRPAEVLQTTSGRLELAPPYITADLPRLRARLARPERSWSWSALATSGPRTPGCVDVLVKGKERCTLLIHPDDARRHGVVSGRPARVSRRLGPSRSRSR